MDHDKQGYENFQPQSRQQPDLYGSGPGMNVPQGYHLVQDDVPQAPPPAYAQPVFEPSRGYNMSHHQDASMQQTNGFKPIAIPCTNRRQGAAYLRAYPPVLREYGISEAMFLEFLDKLNRMSVGSAPVQLIGMAGGILAPFTGGISHIVAQSINGAATVGNIATSVAQTQAHMKASNRDLFGPHGLKAVMGNVQALAKLAHIPILDAAGNISQHEKLLQPLEDPSYGSPGGGYHQEVSAQERRLQALQPYIADLMLLPRGGPNEYDESTDGAQHKKSGIAGFYSSMNQKASDRQQHKAEEKLLEKRGKHAEDMQKDRMKLQEDYQKEMRKLQRDVDKHGPNSGAAMKMREEEMKFQEKFAELDGKNVKDDKEEKLMRKIHWLIITPANGQIEKDIPTEQDPFHPEQDTSQSAPRY